MKACKLRSTYVKRNGFKNCSYNLGKNSSVRKKFSSILHAVRKFVILGDFIVEIANYDMNDFCESYKLKDFVRLSACFKYPENRHVST